jgi:hypothetical protein
MGEPTQGVLERERARERGRERERSLDIGEFKDADLQVVNVDEPMQEGREEWGDWGRGGGGRASPSTSSSSSSTSLRPSSSIHSRGKTPDHKARGTDNRARGTDNRGLGCQRGKTPNTDRSRAKTPEGSGRGIPPGFPRRGIPPGFPPPAAWILATKSILLAKSRTKETSSPS